MNENISPLLNRAVTILDCFTVAHPSLGVREVARKTGYSPSAVGRLMHDLCELGLLTQDLQTREYSLGARALSWAGVFNASFELPRIAKPEMQRLHAETEETISLYIREGTDRVCIEQFESPKNVRIIAYLGRKLPLYAGSAGKVLLAFLDEKSQKEVLSAMQLQQLTPFTITDPVKLIAELEQIKQQGYAVSKGEWLADASGVAAPIFNHKNQIIAALTISGPSQRFSDSVIQAYIKNITKSAMKISNLSGWQQD